MGNKCLSVVCCCCFDNLNDKIQDKTIKDPIAYGNINNLNQIISQPKKERIVFRNEQFIIDYPQKQKQIEKITSKRPTVLSDEEIKILMQTTQLSKEAIINRHKKFLIKCPDGLLNKSKFKQIYTAFFPNGNAAKFSNYLFEAFDKEKTGYINFFQYLTALFFLTNKNGNLRDQLVIAFKVYDIDGNGKLDQNELEAIIDSLFDLRGIPLSERRGIYSTPVLVKNIISDLDKKSDRLISEDEFVEGCLKYPLFCELLLPSKF